MGALAAKYFPLPPSETSGEVELEWSYHSLFTLGLSGPLWTVTLLDLPLANKRESPSSTPIH